MMDWIEVAIWLLAAVGVVSLGAIAIGGLTLVASLAAISRRRRGVVIGKGMRDRR